MSRDKRRRLREATAKRSANSRKGASARDPMLVEANQILADLASAHVSYRFSFYAVEPQWLSGNLDVPLDGRLHAHGDVGDIGMLHLPETYRRNTIYEASLGFTAPFVAVLHNHETASEPAGHVVPVYGADLTSEMLLGPWHIIQAVRRLSRLHFAALLGMPTAEGEWTASSRDEMQEVVQHFQLRVEAEAVLAAGPYLNLGYGAR